MTNPTPSGGAEAPTHGPNTEVPPPPMGALVATLIGALLIGGILVGGYYTMASSEGTSTNQVVLHAAVPSPALETQEDGMKVGRFNTEEFSNWMESVDLPRLTTDVPVIEWEACSDFHDALKAVDSKRGAEDYGFVGMFFHYYDLFNEARPCYLKAHELDPQDHRWPHYLGYLAENVGDFKAAEKWWLEDLELNPAYGATYMQLGHMYAQEARYDEAFDMYTKARQYDPGNPFPCTELADIEIKRKNYYRAEELCKEALEYRPTDKRAFALLAMVYGRTDRQAEADRAIFQAGQGVDVFDPVPDDLVMDLRRKTNALSYWELLAEVQFNAKVWDQLRATLIEISKRDPRLMWRLQLANTYTELKEWDEAEGEALYVRRTEPENPVALEVLGRIDFHQGDYPAAIAHFDQSLALDPRAAKVWELKLRAHGQLRQYNEGIAAAVELLNLDQTNWRGHRYRGKLFYSLGDSLYGDYLRIMKSKPADEAAAKDLLAKSMLAFKESYGALQKAKSINPVADAIHQDIHTIEYTIQEKIAAHPEFRPPGAKAPVPHDHDGDGIPDHAPGAHDDSAGSGPVPHDHDGDGKPDH